MHIHNYSHYNVLLEAVAVFQEISCLHTFKHDVRRITELHLSTKLRVCWCSG